MTRIAPFESRVRFRSAFLACISCAVAVSCAVGRSEYQLASERASDAYVRGKYREAEAAWQRAESVASEERDRVEARYRRAASAVRAGDEERGRDLLLELARTSPESERAPRALLDAAELESKRGDRARAAELFADVIHRYPDAAAASSALKRWLELVAPDASRRVATLDALLAERAWPAAFDEQLRYERARSLESLERLDEAVAAYRDVAERHPYPFGAYWDDALLRQAELERRRGRAQEALAAIDRLLREREGAALNGTNERYRFAPAQFEKAEILRDDLRDVAAARRAFRAVFTDFETSRLRDDALWQEAKLAGRDRSGPGACEPLTLLVRELPDSRYSRCASLLCPSLRGESEKLGECASYVVRELQNGPEP